MTPADFLRPMSAEEHFAQVAAVRASLLLGNRTERHNAYPRLAPIDKAHGAVIAMVAAADQHKTGTQL